jgi:hypothetical protein
LLDARRAAIDAVRQQEKESAWFVCVVWLLIIIFGVADGKKGVLAEKAKMKVKALRGGLVV